MTKAFTSIWRRCSEMPNPTMTAQEFLDALEKQSKNDKALTSDQLQEYAINSLNGLRGLNRSDKLKVLRRMRKLLDA